MKATEPQSLAPTHANTVAVSAAVLGQDVWVDHVRPGERDEVAVAALQRRLTLLGREDPVDADHRHGAVDPPPEGGRSGRSTPGAWR